VGVTGGRGGASYSGRVMFSSGVPELWVRLDARAGVALFWWELTERVIAAVALVAAAPVMIGAGAAVFVLSGGRAPLIAHRRVGRDGVSFWMVKIRTMWPGRRAAEWGGLVERVTADELPAVKLAGDSRVPSRFARALRKYSVDELPQLIHVLRGEMALVGPRPLMQSELKAYYGDCAREVLSVRPGVTGLWQVMGRSRLTYGQRRELDLALVRSGPVRVKAGILLRTVWAVVSGRDSW